MRRGKLKPRTVVLLMVAASLLVYFAIRNQHSADMTTKQKIIRAIYPVLMAVTRFFGQNSKTLSNPSGIAPAISFYSLKATTNSGSDLPFDQFKGKKVLLVNTASECGYTPQYDDLQKLYRQFGQKLAIIGFPANDFGGQEKHTDDVINQFCKVNFGVEFTLAKKSIVVKGPNQNKIFEWLSRRDENGWNDQAPTWNFSKYLVDERGILTHYFDPSISPTSPEMLSAINE
jgi:glutathione peroxidase